MDPRMFRLLLLGVFIVLFMNEVIRFCYLCDHFDGFECLDEMKSCWKFNLEGENRSCLARNYYYYDYFTGRYLFRYTKLSCEPCEAGMLQLFFDTWTETFCCNDKNRCNTGKLNLDVEETESEH